MINPAHIDLFRAVLRHGGMSRAAAALGIGQPHVSRAIAQLETELGFSLFVRGHGSAIPTREGDAFAREVEKTYAGLDHLRRAAQRIRETGVGSLRIACQPALALRLLPRALRRLRVEHPDADIAVHVPGPETAWSWVASGHCDLGLVRPRTGYTEVVAERFLSSEAVCALPRTHPLESRRQITGRDLENEALIAGAAGIFQQNIEDWFAAAGVPPRFTALAQYTAARCGLVAEGLGLAIVDPVAARELTGLRIKLRPLFPRLPIDTMLIRPNGRPPTVLSTRLIALLEDERDELASSRTNSASSRSHRKRASTRFTVAI